MNMLEYPIVGYWDHIFTSFEILPGLAFGKVCGVIITETANQVFSMAYFFKKNIYWPI